MVFSTVNKDFTAVRCLCCADSDGYIFIGSVNQVFIFDITTKKLTPMDALFDMPVHHVYSFKQEDISGVMIGTSSGVFLKPDGGDIIRLNLEYSNCFSIWYDEPSNTHIASFKLGMGGRHVKYTLEGVSAKIQRVFNQSYTAVGDITSKLVDLNDTRYFIAVDNKNNTLDVMNAKGKKVPIRNISKNSFIHGFYAMNQKLICLRDTGVSYYNVD